MEHKIAQETIVHNMKKRCVIIGASPDTGAETLISNIKPEDYIVCADGGHTLAMQAGIRPQLIIGDFDSSPVPDASECEIIKLPTHKDDTDTMYCIKECIRRGYRKFLLLGATGGRADHTYANYSALMYLEQNGCHGCIVSETYCVFMLQDRAMKLTNKSGCGFSVFAFGCESCTVTLRGFEYNGERLTLEACFPLGVSNRIVSDNAELTVHSGTAIAYIELMNTEDLRLNN